MRTSLTRLAPFSRLTVRCLCLAGRIITIIIITASRRASGAPDRSTPITHTEHRLPRHRPAGFFVSGDMLRRDVQTIDFTKYGGLVPAVIQDAESGEVLMVGFMNEAALAKTRETGFATFFSRTRGRLWTKGEASG